MKTIACFILFSLIAVDVYAGDSTIVSFSIANKYVFAGNEHCPGGIVSPFSYSETIIADTSIEGHTYFEFLRSKNTFIISVTPTDTGVLFYRRADSTSVYQYSIKDKREDTLVNFSDTVGTHYNSGNWIAGKSKAYVFGAFYPSVHMAYDDIIYSARFFRVSLWPEYLCSAQLSLVAAQIGGSYFGDSVMLSVKSRTINIPNTSQYVLYQNHPNPFNPSTQIEYYAPQIGHLSLIVFDILGRQVTSLVDGEVESGRHTVTFDGTSHSSGVYYYILRGGYSIQAKKFILLK